MDDIRAQLNRIEDKLDSHLDRISRTERDIKWIRGTAKWSLTAIITLVGSLATSLYHLLTHK